MKGSSDGLGAEAYTVLYGMRLLCVLSTGNSVRAERSVASMHHHQAVPQCTVEQTYELCDVAVIIHTRTHPLG